jgi:hypothetical protein
MARLYADEDFPFPIVERLRQLGHDVVTTYEEGQANQKIGDAEQLAYATAIGRTILTRNRRHFVRLHKANHHHAGIVSITDDPDLDGQANRIHDAIVASITLENQHLRVNRPSRSNAP